MAQLGLAKPVLADRTGDRGGDLLRDLVRQCAVESVDRSEMMQQVGVGATDPAGDGLERDRAHPFLAQQVARRGERDPAAFVRRHAFTHWQPY